MPIKPCFPMFCLQISMLLTVELSDAAGDAAQGKRTLVVQRGAVWAARCATTLTVVTFASLPLLWWLGLPPRIAMFVALPLPIALWQTIVLSRGAFRDPKRWNSLAFSGVLLFVTTSLAELSGTTFTALTFGATSIGP